MEVWLLLICCLVDGKQVLDQEDHKQILRHQKMKMPSESHLYNVFRERLAVAVAPLLLLHALPNFLDLRVKCLPSGQEMKWKYIYQGKSVVAKSEADLLT